MAKVQRVEFIDDIDGKPIDPNDLHRVELEVKLPGRRATRYTLDLRSTNVARFEKDLAKYLDNATRITRAGKAQPSTRDGAGSALSKEEVQAIRQWAIDAGYELSARGRLPHSVIDDYRAAHEATHRGP